MVSNRSRYVSESTTDDETGDMEYLPNNQVPNNKSDSSWDTMSNMSDFPQNKPARKPTRTPKCFSKNALMARENRLKKKMYISSLENQVANLRNDNNKLSHTLENQSFTMDELKKEVKYLKSILANNEGITKLIRAINASTGMAVTTSLDKKLTIPNKQVPSKSPIAQKEVPKIEVESPKKTTYASGFDFNRHPWEETDPCSPYQNYPTPESTTTSCYGSPEFEELNNEGLLLDMDIPIDMNNDELLDMINEKALESPMVPIEDQHNSITTESKVMIKEEEDVGVCLHVSNNKVSLEFCPSCSGNALQSWKFTS